MENLNLSEIINLLTVLGIAAAVAGFMKPATAAAIPRTVNKFIISLKFKFSIKC